MNELKYPILARLAKIYLSIQATSAASERTFSRAEALITKKRNKLKPHTAGKMFYVNRNFDDFKNEVGEDGIAELLQELVM